MDISKRRKDDAKDEKKKKGHDWAYLLPEIWRTVTRHPITLGFPKTPLALPSSFRGRVVAEAEACRGCGLCVRDCPAEALEMERKGRDEFRLIYHPDRCAYCGQCAESCHQGAIRLINAFTAPTTDRTELVEVLVERTPEAEEEG
jgi:formate hydrogenlyase subunit 6/NADH:ubiquinone oxidoreductase subunit I